MKHIVLLLALCSLVGCSNGGDDDAALDCSDVYSTAEDPTVTITTPSNPHEVDSGGTINWSVLVEDPDSDVQDITLMMEDTIDVTPVEVDVEMPNPGSDGVSAFVMEASILGAGNHPLRVTATDPDGCTGDEQVVVCVDAGACP